MEQQEMFAQWATTAPRAPRLRSRVPCLRTWTTRERLCATPAQRDITAHRETGPIPARKATTAQLALAPGIYPAQ